MRLISIHIVLLLFGLSSHAQTTAPRNTISAAGKSVTTTGGSNYMYNVGGLVVSTTSPSNSIVLTQGFEQAEMVSDIIIFNPSNAFSPDGDGINDTWILPLPTAMQDNSTVVIFNRWGDEIAKIENYNNLDKVWNGTYRESGEPVTEGTFFYIVESETAKRKFSGWVQVIR